MTEREPPQTAEEIASLLEALARNQADRDLAARLRDWSRTVEQIGQYRLRADAASIQSELYKTLEELLEETRAAMEARLETIEVRLSALEALRQAGDG